MKYILLIIVCCLGLVAAPRAHGQGFYLSGNGGVSLADDVDVHKFLVRMPGAEFDLEPGGRFSVAGGYNFCPFLGVQAETGFIYNKVRHVDAALPHVPLLADVVLRYDQPDCKWVPYLGAGAGGDVSVIDLDHVRGPTGAVVDGSAGDVVFAWQAFAGLRYKITEQISLGAGYKFFWADGASWDVRHTSGNIETGKAQVHSIGVDFVWKF